MIPLYYDLHIHSCLSPCGDDDMTPANLVGMAAVKGLDVIALTDHNTCKNCPAAMHHGAEYGVTVIPGMELTTEEEIHVICLFPSLQDALSFDALIGSKLMPFPNREDIFGKQQIMNEKDEVTGNLGFVPPGSTFSCAEFHDFANLHRIRREHPYFQDCNVICCSDAHYLWDIREPEYKLYAHSREIPDILKALNRRRR